MKNKHESQRAADIAGGNTILRVQVGSGLHGVTVDNQDDRDEMGVCIEPASCVIGLETFEQFQYRTQPEGVRSGPGDLDLVIYSLRKWTRLAAQGNPTVLLLLFAPREQWVDWRDPYAGELQENAHLYLSKECGRRFLGYLESQKARLLGLKSRRTNRPELIDLYGYDTKFAYHAIRLGLQGIELLTTGKISLPMPEPYRSILTKLRKGHYSKEYALEWVDHLSNELSVLTEDVDLPDAANVIALNKWLTDVYTGWWHDKGSDEEGQGY